MCNVINAVFITMTKSFIYRNKRNEYWNYVAQCFSSQIKLSAIKEKNIFLSLRKGREQAIIWHTLTVDINKSHLIIL